MSPKQRRGQLHTVYDIILPVISVPQLHLVTHTYEEKSTVQHHKPSFTSTKQLHNHFSLFRAWVNSSPFSWKLHFIYLSYYYIHEWSTEHVHHESERTVYPKMKIMDYLGCFSCHSIAVLHFCLHVEDISNNFGNQTVSVLLTWLLYFFVYLLTNFLQNNLFCEKDMRRSTWWHNFHFCVDYPLKSSQHCFSQHKLIFCKCLYCLRSFVI